MQKPGARFSEYSIKMLHFKSSFAKDIHPKKWQFQNVVKFLNSFDIVAETETGTITRVFWII